MVKIFMHGCLGRMGRVITSMCEASEGFEITCGGDIMPAPAGFPYPVYSDLNECKEDFDAIIDFSNAKAVPGVIEFALKRNKPLICCTTALEEDTVRMLEDASLKIPVFKSANMSLGMNVLFELVKQAASVFYPDYDIEILEAHHNRKLDAPSGSAYSIADAIQSAVPDELEFVYDRHAVSKPRGRKEIGFSSIRGGNIVGEHEVFFINDEETVKISHSAKTRDVFAKGALAAADFVKDKPAGYYDMQDIVSEKFGGK